MRQTNRMLVSMVILFGSMWLPINLINLIADLELVDLNCWKYYHAAFTGCHVIAMSSTCCNPFLYGRFNDSFRKEFLKFCPSLRLVCGSETVEVVESVQNETPMVNVVKSKSQIVMKQSDAAKSTFQEEHL